MGGDDGELGDGAVFVFEFDGERIGAENRGGEADDVSEFIGGNAVVLIVGDPSLELAGDGGSGGATAVDEILLDVSDFGDVEVCGDGVAVGEAEVNGGVWGGGESGK